MVKQNLLEQNVAEFIQDITKLKCLEAVVNVLQSENEEKLIRGIVAVNKVFSHLFGSEKDFLSSANPLCDQFTSSWSHLLHVLTQADAAADLAMQTLLKWILLETVILSNEENYIFPEDRLEKLVAVLCGEKKMMRKHSDKLIAEMQKFGDLNYFVCKALWKVSEKFTMPTTDEAIWNYFNLMKAICIGEGSSKDDKSAHVICRSKSFSLNEKELRKFYQFGWINFLRASLPEKLYIHVLVVLDEKKVAQFKNPCLLGDFLIESYNKGGAVALLALNGLFTLIHKYNLELPDFYMRLYALFRPEIFYTKYRARFFFLADVYLSSTHLPAYLVAAFAKKMARLCLTAPAYSQLHVIPFIGNLIIRHAALNRMVNCAEIKDFSNDPFEESEPDPAKSHALESSLWELQTLQHHWLYRAAGRADIVDKAFPKIEWDFTDLLECDYSKLFTMEKFTGHVPTNYHKPKGLLRHADDCMASAWVLG